MTGTIMRHATTHPSPVPASSGRRERLSPDVTRLFAYGTLQFDAVLEALINRIPQRISASAPGWRAASLEGRVYPGLVAAPGPSALGVLLTDLSRREWAILDAFEDNRYDLREVTLTSGGRGLAYIWPGGEVRDEDWDAEQFRVRHLQEYAARCARIAPRLAAEAGQ
ncbi:gamma-glutamylcyclotransferase family protein [Streptomyces sp. NPDC015032]|uniref:gamma-glutamylcyclotransferase family protein n=1 Tax=Streptomyces sp. NPDC015032 TaxID=3364937 RepID=UPI0036FAECEE